MSLSVTQINQSFTDPTSGQPFSNVNVSFQVSQVLYIAGIPTVTPASVIAAEVVGGELLSAAGGLLELADQGNVITLQSGTGFWYWTVTITGDITDQWSFMLAHSASPVELYATKNTPAIGAAWAGGTATEYVAPAVVTLTDAATVAVSAAAGNDFRLLLTSAIGSTRAIGAPSSPVDGQHIVFQLTQPASGGPCSVTWNSMFDFGAGSAPTLSTTASDTDLVAFAYNAAKAKWLCLGSQLGF